MTKNLYCIVVEDNGVFDITENDDGFVFMSRKEVDDELLLYKGSVLSSLNPRIAKLTFVDEKK